MFRDRLPRPTTLALIATTVLASACASLSRGGSEPQYAYARAGDSLVVAVSVRTVETSGAARSALAAAAKRAAAQERCDAGPLSVRGEHDPRLAADAVRWLPVPHRVAVLACAVRPAALQ